jgi:hypothetical protein
MTNSFNHVFSVQKIVGRNRNRAIVFKGIDTLQNIHELNTNTCNLTVDINSVAFSPQANCTDCATATCRRNLVQTFADRGMLRSQCGGSPQTVDIVIILCILCISNFEIGWKIM